MQPVRTLGKGMSEPADPHKIVPNLWSMGILEGGLSPGMPWHPWGVPTSQTWGVECSQGCPGTPGEIPTSSQNPSPTLRELFQGQDPGSSPPARVPDMSSELRGRWDSGWEKDLLYSRHWSHFLSLNFLLWPNSRVRTPNQGGL